MATGRASSERIAALMGALGGRAAGGPPPGPGMAAPDDGAAMDDGVDEVLSKIDGWIGQVSPEHAAKLEQAKALIEECIQDEGGEEPPEDEMEATEGAAPPADILNEK